MRALLALLALLLAGTAEAAPKYWVGATNTWNSTASTKWASTSGGAGGQPIPGAADNVFFTSASIGTVTLSVSPTIINLDMTGFTGTLAGSSGGLSPSGNVTLGTGMSWTHTGALGMGGGGSRTLDTNGVVMNAGGIDMSASNVTLTDNLALTASQASVGNNRYIVANAGVFDANDFNVSIGVLTASSGARTVSMGNGTWTLNAPSGGNAFIMSLGTDGLLTLNPEGATLIVDNAATVDAGQKIFDCGDYQFGPIIIENNQNFDVYSSCRFTNATFQGPLSLTFSGAYTIRASSFTFSGTGVSIAGRTTAGIKLTLIDTDGGTTTANGVAFFGVDFTGGTFDCTNCFNGYGGNTGINFLTAPATGGGGGGIIGG